MISQKKIRAKHFIQNLTSSKYVSHSTEFIHAYIFSILHLSPSILYTHPWVKKKKQTNFSSSSYPCFKNRNSTHPQIHISISIHPIPFLPSFFLYLIVEQLTTNKFRPRHFVPPLFLFPFIFSLTDWCAIEITNERTS